MGTSLANHERPPASASPSQQFAWAAYHADRDLRLSRLDWMPALVAQVSLLAFLNKYRDHISLPPVTVILFLCLNGINLLALWRRAGCYVRWRSAVVSALRLALCLDPVMSLVVRVAMASSLEQADGAAAEVGAAGQAGLGHVAFALVHASHAYSLAALALFYPLPLAWQLPVQLASTLSMVWHNRAFCAVPLLQSSTAWRLLSWLQGLLRPLQYLVPLPLLLPTLADPNSLCAAGTAWVQVFLGLLLPTYIRLRWDLQAIVSYAYREGLSLPAPSKDWESWLFCWGYRLLCTVDASYPARLLFWLAAAGQTWLLCTLAYS